MITEPSEENDYQQGHARLLCDSYTRLTGQILMESGPDAARRLYEAPFVVLSHTTDAEPLFNYANRCAQALFEMDWESFLLTPSRLSAEPVEQSERARLLEQVTTRGYIDDYSGIRISSSGRRFRIDRAIVWNLSDEAGVFRGQAATFGEWSAIL